MNKITKKTDAGMLVKKMMENPELQIILWDEADSNRIMTVEADPEMMGIWCVVTFVDTVNGTETRKGCYFVEARQEIWENRKNVNKLNDMASL